MNKLKKTLVLTMALLLAAPVASQAASSSYETEVTYGVNFRSAPNVDAYVFRMIPKGEDIHVIEKTNQYWLKIKVQDGTIGYISSNAKYTDYKGSSSSSTGTIIKGVNFRSAPKVANNKIGFINKGASVRILEKTNQWWVKIQYNGRTGYVDADYISTGSSSNSSNSGSSGSGSSNTSSKADQIIAFAKSLQGK